VRAESLDLASSLLYRDEVITCHPQMLKLMLRSTVGEGLEEEEEARRRIGEGKLRRR
jgi:hypothetical protein